MPKYYFAYGSNIDLNRMKEREVEFVSYQRAILENYTLRFNKYSYKTGCGVANIETKEGDYVEGVLYELENPEEGISRLDYFEGFFCENCLQNHYLRRIMKVKTNDGREVEAYVYVANPIHVDNSLKPSLEYLRHLLSGCERKILSEEYCKRLKEFLKNICRKEKV